MSLRAENVDLAPAYRDQAGEEPSKVGKYGFRGCQVLGDLGWMALLAGAGMIAALAVLNRMIDVRMGLDRKLFEVIEPHHYKTLIALPAIGVALGGILAIYGIRMHVKRRQAEEELKDLEARKPDDQMSESQIAERIKDLRGRIAKCTAADMLVGPLAAMMLSMAIVGFIVLSQLKPFSGDVLSDDGDRVSTLGSHLLKIDRSFVKPWQSLAITLMVVGGVTAVGTFLLRNAPAILKKLKGEAPEA